MRQRAAHECHLQQPGALQIADELPQPCQMPRILPPRRASANALAAGFHHLHVCHMVSILIVLIALCQEVFARWISFSKTAG
jgi:hypothetical protein